MTLFSGDLVYAPRQLASWGALAFGAGALNATAFAACERFVTHVTGTVTHLGVHASLLVAIDYLLVVACFIGGAMAAVLLAHPPGRPAPTLAWLPLALAAALLLGAAALGRLGVFGDFGSAPETRGHFGLLSLLAFAMGLQNASVSTATGNLVRTTHMTGPATDLGVALAQWMRGSEAPAARRSVLLRATKLLAFAVGATVGYRVAGALGYSALVLPALVCATVAATTLRVPRLRELGPAT